MSYSVFISYATENHREADEVREALESQGIQCWIAPRNIPSGELYPTEIMRGIHSSQVVVAVLSSHANQSPWVVREIERAVHLRKLLIPFRVESVLPQDGLELMLSVPQWLDAFPSPRSQKLLELVNDVRSYLARENRDEHQHSATKPLDVQTRPALDDPKLISQHWQQVVALPDARETILQIVDQMVKCKPPTVCFKSLTEAARKAVPALESAGVLRLQPARVPEDGRYIVFCNRWLVRQALAEWVEFRGMRQPQELPRAANTYPPLADGIALFMRSQHPDRVIEMLKSWLPLEGSGIERLIGRVVADLEDRPELADNTVDLVLAQGTFSAIKGLTFAAKQLMEQRRLSRSFQIYESVLCWCQQQTLTPEQRRFRVEIANEQGRLTRRLGQLQKAIGHFRQTMQEAEDLGDPGLTGTVANNLAGVLIDSNPTVAGLPNEAIGILERNVERLTMCGQLRQLAVAYHLLGRVYSANDPAKAETYFQLDVDTCRRQEDLAALADALDSFGVFLVEQGRLEDAERAHAEEVQLFEKIVDPRRYAIALANLGSVFLRQALGGKATALEQARSSLEQSRSLFTEFDLPEQSGPAIENLARCYQLQGAAARARSLLEECTGHYRRFAGGSAIAQEIQQELDQWPEKDSPLA